MQLNMRQITAALALGCSLVAIPAVAQTAAVGRYTMHPVDDGFLRLDTRSGAVAHCLKNGSRWNCRPLDGANATDRREIARLAQENAELKKEIKRLEEIAGVRAEQPSKRADKQADPPRPGGQSPGFRLPSEKQVDQALNYFERMLRKFQDRLKRLEKNQGPESKPL